VFRRKSQPERKPNPTWPEIREILLAGQPLADEQWERLLRNVSGVSVREPGPWFYHVWTSWPAQHAIVREAVRRGDLDRIKSKGTCRAVDRGLWARARQDKADARWEAHRRNRSNDMRTREHMEREWRDADTKAVEPATQSEVSQADQRQAELRQAQRQTVIDLAAREERLAAWGRYEEAARAKAEAESEDNFATWVAHVGAIVRQDHNVVIWADSINLWTAQDRDQVRCHQDGLRGYGDSAAAALADYLQAERNARTATKPEPSSARQPAQDYAPTTEVRDPANDYGQPGSYDPYMDVGRTAHSGSGYVNGYGAEQFGDAPTPGYWDNRDDDPYIARPGEEQFFDYGHPMGWDPRARG
jgi:hypothetical protein